MTRNIIAAACLAMACAWPCVAELTLNDDGKALTITEDGKPVLVYRYTWVEPPEGVSAKFRRMSYIHPLYGPDGDVLTQDYPDDHRHHLGVFWTWPCCKAGERDMDVWAIGGVRQVFEEWLVREQGAGHARVGVQNVWKFDDDPESKVRERVFFTVHPSNEWGRAIDFHFQFQNVSNDIVSFRGATTDDKGYGGFCFRPDKARKPLTFTSARGNEPKDVLVCETPWVDVVSRSAKDGPLSGLAIFQHPSNPGYPHPGWILREYGFLGASWPHNDTKTLQPGEYFELQYRLYVHRGTAEDAGVAAAFQQYVDAGE